jgi:Ca2+-binding RTX toxin-like protein
MGSGLRALVTATLVALGVSTFITTAGAGAAISPTSNADALAEALDNTGPDSAVTGAALQVEPPHGNPAAVADTPLAVFPLQGSTYAMLSTGDTTLADKPNDSDNTSTNNGGGGAGHGASVFDLVTLRIDLDIPAERNCLTVDYRFLTEEFDEFIGSDFNDAFLAEIDASTFLVADDGSVDAPKNFAVGPRGEITTVNTAGTSADNALGTTYDGATPVLRATTPVSAGPESIFLSVYDASDEIFDSTVFVDNLRLRTTDPENCKRGTVDNPRAGETCQGEEPTVYAVNGRAEGTPGDDVILGSPDPEVIRGRGGNDVICAGGGADLVRGGPGADVIVGNRGGDDLRGGKGNDVIKGSRGNDEIRGHAGEDRIRGGKGDDRLFGGAANDELYGNAGDDLIRGRRGDDYLNGGRGDDLLGGGPGTDNCVGGPGRDVIRNCEGRLPGSDA